MKLSKRIAALAAAALSLLLPAGSAQAKAKVVVTYPYIESLLREIAHDQVDVTVLAKGDEDPHFVVPRPSFIGKLRQADLLVVNGASLEIGYVPPLVRQANNPKVMPGGEGFVELSQFVDLMGKVDKVSRTEGDIHPDGNPHFILDWHNVPALAKGLSEALVKVDPAGKDAYQQGLAAFLAKWKERSDAWDQRALPLKGKKFIQYHRLFNYFAHRTGMEIAGELEPKPGIPPTSRHMEELIALGAGGSVWLIVGDAFHEHKSAEVLSQKLGIPAVVLPQDVGAVAGAKDLYSFYDTLLGSTLR